MSQSNRRALVIFPGALGDFLCFLPALVALAQRTHQTTLLARSDWTALLDHPRITSWSLEHPALTQLYRDDFRPAEWVEQFGRFDVAYSWSGFGDRRFTQNLLAAVGLRAAVFPFGDFRAGEHASEYFARCVALPPASRNLVQQYLRIDPGTIVTQVSRWREPALLIHPGSGAERKNWRGFSKLAALWRARTGGRIVVALGPAELEHGAPALEADATLAARPLSEIAALLQVVAFFVGNDSGISHLAALVGTRGLVLLSPHTRADHWQPRSAAMACVQCHRPCTLCGPEVFCEHVLPAEEVFARLEELRPRNRSPQR